MWKLFKNIMAPNSEKKVGVDNMTGILVYFPENMGLLSKEETAKLQNQRMLASVLKTKMEK